MIEVPIPTSGGDRTPPYPGCAEFALPLLEASLLTALRVALPYVVYAMSHGQTDWRSANTLEGVLLFGVIATISTYSAHHFLRKL